MTKEKFDLWYKNKWVPEARILTNQLAVLSRFFEKQESAPNKDKLDMLSGKFADIRDTINKVGAELTKLEGGNV
ncbi:MAG: hypothetical protein HC945_03805 [Nitrosarchaeum sp.]|nr:hypothetical protein [Nitrosarchaeum sp.]